MKIQINIVLVLSAISASMVLCPVRSSFPAQEKVEARVNDEILTSSELSRILLPIYRQYEELKSGMELRNLKEKIRRNAISNWVKKQLILQEAKELEDTLQIDPLEVEEELQAAKNRYPSEEEFQEDLKREGLSEEEFKETIEEGLMVQVLTYRNVTSKIIVPPGEIIDYYSRNEEEFQEPVRVRVNHIMIPASEDPEEDKAAYSAAQSIIEKLQQGDDFGSLAREYSRGPHADQGGDLGYFKEGQMLPKLDEAVFKLSVGEHSGIIKTELGYHILKLTGKKKAKQKSFEEAYPGIDEKLFQEKFQEAYEAWMKELEEKAYVVIGD